MEQQQDKKIKIIHLSDLHLGKRIYEFSMLEDQEYILNEIVEIVQTEKPDAVIIAGDVYDRGTPPSEALMLLESFILRLIEIPTKVIIISGNHDSAERLSFCSPLMASSGVYIAPPYQGKTEPIKISGVGGKVNIYPLPFIKRLTAASLFPDEKISSAADAVRAAVEKMNLDPSAQNILVAHQFVTGGKMTDSEEINVGGLDDIPDEIFKEFDYVALGHLHRPQYVNRPEIRYCGTPLKYSFSEAGDEKSVTVIELASKGTPVEIRTVPLKPLRDLRELRGTRSDLTNPQNYMGTETDDYLHITLTDKEGRLDDFAVFRGIYPHLMTLDYDNAQTRANSPLGEISGNVKNPLELFGELFKKQNKTAMTDEERDFVQNLLEQISEGRIVNEN